MTLAWSRHQFVELVRDQKILTWLGCHRRAFEFFGGIPAKVVIDNPKAAITRASAGVILPYSDPTEILPKPMALSSPPVRHESRRRKE